MGRRGWGGQRQRERNLIVRWVQHSMTAGTEYAWEVRLRQQVVLLGDALIPLIRTCVG